MSKEENQIKVICHLTKKGQIKALLNDLDANAQLVFYINFNEELLGVCSITTEGQPILQIGSNPLFDYDIKKILSKHSIALAQLIKSFDDPKDVDTLKHYLQKLYGNQQQFFDIPTREELKAFRKKQIFNASNEELYKMYDEDLFNIQYCPGPSDLIEEWKAEKDMVLSVIKDRDLVMPTFWNKLLGKV